MRITIQYVEGCPHAGLARRRVTDALDQLGIAATPDERLIRTEAEAMALGFRGSPTILVEGADPFPSGATAELSCRLYATDTGIQGAPTVQQLVGVFRP